MFFVVFFPVVTRDQGVDSGKIELSKCSLCYKYFCDQQLSSSFCSVLLVTYSAGLDSNLR